MDIRKLDDDVSVGGQITTDDLPLISARGFKSVICNRPDGEAIDQPDFEDVEHNAKACGLQTRYIPVHHSGLQEADIKAFAAALKEMPHPILAYCRSGARSATIYQAAQTRLG